MKRLSILGIFAFLLVLTIAGLGFRKPVAPSAPATTKTAWYYWYTYPDDTYNDFNTISGEENELFWEYWVPIDQNSAGGTLLMRGYINNVYPHNFPASVFLYGHF
jgi:hypothetical protein